MTDIDLYSKFNIPNDFLTVRYEKAIEKFETLPASFYIPSNDMPDGVGSPILELKKQYVKPIKHIPLYSKLLDGSYHTEKSNSDANIARSISFFKNNFPSFTKYKNTDDLSYIINQHRLLVVELFEYYAKKPTTSLRTIEGRFVAICRIFRIAYDTKTYPLYNLYSDVLLDLNADAKMDEDKGELNKTEEMSYIPFEIVLETQKKLEETFISNPTYQNNQDLLLLSLYSLIPTLRDELKLLEFTTVKQDTGDWLYFDKDNNVILDLNNPKKKHDSISFNLTNDAPHLAEIIKSSYKLFPRKYVFTNYDDIKTKAKVGNLSKRITKIFAFTNKNVGVNSLRSSHATYIDKIKRLSNAEKNQLAKKMRTSKRYLNDSYIKVKMMDNKVYENKGTIQTINEKQPIEMNAYQKQLLRSKRYYDNHKEDILKQQKEYKSSIPKEAKARTKILYYLNNDSEYKNKIKPITMEKHKIKLENGIYI
jgi:hypothetical protein